MKRRNKFGASSDNIRSSHLEVFFKGGALKNFAKLTGK